MAEEENEGGTGMPFIKLSDIQEREMFPGFRAQFVHTENMTCAYWTITAGAMLPDHAHPHEQVTNIIRGRFEMTLDGETQTIEAGASSSSPPGRSTTAGRLRTASSSTSFLPSARTTGKPPPSPAP